jgi:hypothetical protein
MPLMSGETDHADIVLYIVSGKQPCCIATKYMNPLFWRYHKNDRVSVRVSGMLLTMF